jgi:hypothetical protein
MPQAPPGAHAAGPPAPAAQAGPPPAAPELLGARAAPRPSAANMRACDAARAAVSTCAGGGRGASWCWAPAPQGSPSPTRPHPPPPAPQPCTPSVRPHPAAHPAVALVGVPPRAAAPLVERDATGRRKHVVPTGPHARQLPRRGGGGGVVGVGTWEGVSDLFKGGAQLLSAPRPSRGRQGHSAVGRAMPLRSAMRCPGLGLCPDGAARGAGGGGRPPGRPLLRRTRGRGGGSRAPPG